MIRNGSNGAQGGGVQGMGDEGSETIRLKAKDRIISEEITPGKIPK